MSLTTDLSLSRKVKKHCINKQRLKAHLIWSLALLCVQHLRRSFLCLVQMYCFFPSLF